MLAVSQTLTRGLLRTSRGGACARGEPSFTHFLAMNMLWVSPAKSFHEKAG